MSVTNIKVTYTIKGCDKILTREVLGGNLINGINFVINMVSTATRIPEIDVDIIKAERVIRGN